MMASSKCLSNHHTKGKFFFVSADKKDANLIVLKYKNEVEEWSAVD